MDPPLIYSALFILTILYAVGYDLYISCDAIETFFTYMFSLS